MNRLKTNIICALFSAGADGISEKELIMALEEKLDIEIDDAELDQFKTVNDLVSYLETKVQ